MARQLRIEYPNAIYHVTSSGNARNKILFGDHDRENFLSVLNAVVRLYIHNRSSGSGQFILKGGGRGRPEQQE